MLDLSVLAKREDDPLYDMEMHQFTGLAPGNLRAHLHSMKASQRHDYKKGLRIVVTEALFKGGDGADGVVPSRNLATKLASYAIPEETTALQVGDEVVIRHSLAFPGEEYVVRSRDFPEGQFRPLAKTAAAAPQVQVASAATGKRTLNFED